MENVEVCFIIKRVLCKTLKIFIRPFSVPPTVAKYLLSLRNFPFRNNSSLFTHNYFYSSKACMHTQIMSYHRIKLRLYCHRLNLVWIQNAPWFLHICWLISSYDCSSWLKITYVHTRTSEGGGHTKNASHLKIIHMLHHARLYTVCTGADYNSVTWVTCCNITLHSYLQCLLRRHLKNWLINWTGNFREKIAQYIE